MSAINISADVYNGWTYGGATATLKGFATEELTTSTAVDIPGGPATGFYKEIACTVSGSVVTIPLVPIDSTTDSTNPNVRYVFDLYDENDVRRVRFAVVRVPHDQGTPLTWQQLRDYTRDVDAFLGAFAPIASPHFTGVPTAPTAAPGTNTTQLATTEFVEGELGGIGPFAPLADPTFTGNPKAPTPSPGDNDTSIATTAFVAALAALKANLASPTFTGTPAAPTAAPGTNTTQLATTAFAAAIAALKADLASPTFTGNPAAPTPTAADNDTSLATTAFVQGLGQGAKVYRAVISQSSTSAPSATVLVNLTGTTMTWARTSAGVYTLTAGVATFTANKTQIFLGQATVKDPLHDTALYVNRTSTTVITIQVNNTSIGFVDDFISEQAIEIVVYP
jgi:hypothetical protein